VLEPEQLAELAGHVVVEELEATAARLLRGVHRHVRVAEEFLAASLASSMEGDADAGADAQLAAGDPDRLPERG